MRYFFLLQSCQNVFRSMRNVEQMRISVDPTLRSPRVTFQFMCKFGKIYIKLHDLLVSSNLCLQASPRRTGSCMRTARFSKPCFIVRKLQIGTFAFNLK